MLRISITEDLVKFANDFSEALFKDKDRRFGQPLDNLTDLQTIYALNDEARILNVIIYYYYRILKLTPNKQQKWVSCIERNYLHLFYKIHTLGEKPKATKFSEDLFSAFRYDALRKSEASKIVDKIGVKSCIYCNSQLAIVVDKEGTKTARFELDHYFPKAKFPFLSTSFFNLLPSCSNCNKGKSASDVNITMNFHLYTYDNELVLFKFKLEDSCIAEYLAKKDRELIKIEFVDANSQTWADKHNEDFAIIPIYSTQIDIVEELLWRHECYSKAKKKDLRRFGIMFKDIEMRNKMVVGNLVNENQIHKRPLAKFTQDIAIQLKLIK